MRYGWKGDAVPLTDPLFRIGCVFCRALLRFARPLLVGRPEWALCVNHHSSVNRAMRTTGGGLL